MRYRGRRAVRGVLLVGLVSFGLLLASPEVVAPVSAQSTAATPDSGAFEHDRLAAYARVKHNAREWLDDLDVDATFLSRIGMKGKKKLAEILGAYASLHRYADEDDRAAILERVTQLAEQTRSPAYHDLVQLEESRFDEESMSYLRVMWLLRELGQDVSFYADQLAAVKERMDAHLIRRGPWQRAMFASYYEDLGLEKPPLLEEATLSGGRVESRLSADLYDPPPADGSARRTAPLASYELTHEIFVAFNYGFRRVQTHFDAADSTYLANTLPSLTIRFLDEENPDLVGELVACMVLLGHQNDPACREGIDYLLGSQNSDGSWGDYEQYRPMWRDFLEQRIYLHTTMVALWGLLEFFEGSWVDVAEVSPPGSQRASRRNPTVAPRPAELAHAAYEGILDAPVQLIGGRYEGEPFVPDGASRPVVEWVGDLYVTGDLTADGADDAAVLLTESSGGSGTRLYLAVVSLRAGQTVNEGTALVGDRTQVRAMNVDGGRVWLDVVEHGPDDAACCPTQLARKAWALRGGALVETGAEVTGTLSLDAAVGEWILTHLARDEPVDLEPELTLSIQNGEVAGSGGCNRFLGAIVETSPGKIEIGPLGSTRMACAEDAMRREGIYLQRLQSARQYSFLAGQLALTWRVEDRLGVLLFAKRP